MMARGVICPPIQSMVVVTSPMADQAPPALAAMTIIDAKNKRSLGLSSSFRISEIITIVVVRLSRIALRKKVTKPTSHIRVACFLVRISEVITSKPLCASITSTIVMAPIRKNTIWAVEETDSLSCCSTRAGLPLNTAYTVHSTPAPTSADADLLTLIGCSNAIAAYAMTKIVAITLGSIWRSILDQSQSILGLTEIQRRQVYLRNLDLDRVWIDGRSGALVMHHHRREYDHKQHQ